MTGLQVAQCPSDRATPRATLIAISQRARYRSALAKHQCGESQGLNINADFDSYIENTMIVLVNPDNKKE